VVQFMHKAWNSVKTFRVPKSSSNSGSIFEALSTELSPCLLLLWRQVLDL
jgi:hypothetical protein